MNQISTTLLQLAFEEDLQDIGDLTTLHFVDRAHRSQARIVSRESAVVSGIGVAKAGFAFVDPGLEIEVLAGDGSAVEPGDVVLTVTGTTQSILTAERTVLNFLQRLSGVATVTRAYRDLISHTKAQLLDTRKTTPGFRELEKVAVLHGGGTNHRIGLYDAVMVKDNHLAANLTPVDMAERVRDLRREMPELKIEVEADLLEQVEKFLRIPEIDVILLDNMSNDELVRAVAMRNEQAPRIQLEASGGVNLKTIAGIAETGVDFISVGALTHSVRAIDFGLDSDRVD